MSWPGKKDNRANSPFSNKRLGKFHMKSKSQWTRNQLGFVSFPANSNTNSFLYLIDMMHLFTSSKYNVKNAGGRF
jgi:hypothetical protein